jgi:H+/Cl- antiporter ClcA
LRSTLGQRIFFVIAVLIGAAGIIGVVVTASLRILTGHCTDVFQNGYGQYETWASSAGAFIGASILLVGGYLLRLWQLRKRSRLEGISAKDFNKELKRGL